MLAMSRSGIEEPGLITIERSQLDQLINYAGDLCLSIYMPAEGVQRQRQQGSSILLRNLIKEADDRLAEPPYELRPRQRQRLLRPVQRIVRSDGNFWSYQRDGLAFFLAADLYRLVRLPVPVPAQVILGPRFYIKPLLACPMGDHAFYILALSLKQTYLFRATCASIEQLPLPHLTTSLADSLQYDQFEKELQFRGGASAPGAPGQRLAFFYSHDNVSDRRKQDVLSFCKELDDGLQRYLHDDNPLIVAGVDYLAGLYKQVNSYPHLLATIAGSPEAMSLQDLHAAAWTLVQPLFQAPRKKALEALPGYMHEGRASTQLPEILPAAHAGRVQTLFVAHDRELWGRFEPPAGPLEVAGADCPGMGREPLLNLATIYTLRAGGVVYTLPAEEVPGPDALAAILYY